VANRTIAACAVIAVLYVGIQHFIEYRPNQKQNEVRFALAETGRMVETVRSYVLEDSSIILSQTIAVEEATAKFADGWEYYHNGQYSDAIDSLKSARDEIFEAFPPRQYPEAYVPPFSYTGDM